MPTMIGTVISTVRERLMKTILAAKPSARMASHPAAHIVWPEQETDRPGQRHRAKREDVALVDVIFDDDARLHVPFQRQRRDEAEIHDASINSVEEIRNATRTHAPRAVRAK